MASVDDVLDVITEINHTIQDLNESYSQEETLEILASGLSEPDADFGHAQVYIDRVADSLAELRAYIGLPTVYVAMAGVNDMIENLHAYYRRSWWQFGSGRDKRTATHQLPTAILLEEI